ncbi:antibiotic ABC transporter ATP-binding protein [Flavobacterium branchiophilum NBRC 15030 = ATCC 35035]|uniref:ABC-type multidrug transport system fused ATPase/permease subunit n=1 Tax=Flavobacterium branchiophilum TaxID=55197 RepID=A0A543G0I7_9FLAO|nr:ABC transporter ATP-binding protein [Flavobacterium branchiophilum]OXA82408.1 antibiotic ABC transporter ATP-binding protein [Flavobacterium branchiophilum NBRC 15030 = ATCC 35035]TQM39575.1 ABC-type multidrug transport system fused ATPase/permease subunit [Flavobacterium branchiophilum]GEM56074.1 xenobiotic ABC transporter ATP-binding protein [Flavobacterium branchiophilum NBRC 15030 = ATCC 35035]
MKAKAFDIQLFSRILKFTKPYRFRFNSVILFAVLLSVFSALRPYLLKQTVDGYIKTHDQYGLLLYIILMGVVLLLEAFSNFYFVYWANWLGQDIVKDIRVKLFHHMMGFRMKYYDNAPVGQLVTRSVSDIESIAKIFSQGLFMIGSDLMKMVVILGFMLYMNWKLTWIVIVAMPILVFFTRIFQRKMQIAFEEVRNQVANLNTFVQERVTGMKIVQLFNREKIEYDKFKAINAKHNKAWIKTVWYNSIFFPIADIISSFTLGFVVLYGGFNILNGDQFTTFGDLFSYTMFIGMLFNPLRQIADKFNEMQMGMIAANRVFDILDTKDEIQDLGTMKAPKFAGDIQFEQVRFSYIEGEEVVKGINLEVKPGQMVAIVGATGAGKSTIINLLNRFYDIDSGNISIDGENIKNYTLESLRVQIAVVLQDVFLFADSILNNITLHNPAISRETVIEASKKIGVYEFIMSLPNGFDYNVKERGVMLSSGQRQLIAFLRAYVSQPSILILDEATSSIDTYSEELIQKATETITKNRTSIVIAHRLATIVNADQIVVMDKGLIVEQGTHQELLVKANGYYKNLYESQFSSIA